MSLTVTEETRGLLLASLMVAPWTFFVAPPLFVMALLAPPQGN